jgi:hypothetical protein
MRPVALAVRSVLIGGVATEETADAWIAARDRSGRPGWARTRCDLLGARLGLDRGREAAAGEALAHSPSQPHRPDHDQREQRKPGESRSYGDVDARSLAPGRASSTGRPVPCEIVVGPHTAKYVTRSRRLAVVTTLAVGARSKM